MSHDIRTVKHQQQQNNNNKKKKRMRKKSQRCCLRLFVKRSGIARSFVLLLGRITLFPHLLQFPFVMPREKKREGCKPVLFL